MPKKKYKPNILRKLARSDKWQFLYSRAKEIGSIELFKNKNEFSELQIEFMRWLQVYNSLYVDLAMKEPHITEEVIEDDILCDAYLLWRSKKKDENKTDSQKDASEVTGIPSVRFK